MRATSGLASDGVDLRGWLLVLGSLLVATAAAGLVVVATQPAERTIRAPASLPYAVKMKQPPVEASVERAVPDGILETAGARVAAFAPGLRLREVRLEHDWQGSRAMIEDLTNGDVRSYAIGDLLPHGSLLVGISTRTADVMVADSELVRLRIDGKVKPLQDLRAAYEARPLERAPDLAQDYREAVEEAIYVLRTGESEVVQAYVDELVACGDPAVEILIDYVDDPVPVAPGPYEVPTGGGTVIEPRLTGDLVIAILERTTGQTFGDPTRHDRREVADAWRRWWGVE